MNNKLFFSPKRRRATGIALVCLLLALGASLVDAAEIWTQKTTASKPAARFQHAMAYLGGDQALLFGGDDGSYLDDTWVYDLSANTWTNPNPGAKPSARYAHVMAYLGGDQALLLGGTSGSGWIDETWVYDLSDNAWTNKSPAASTPPGRLFPAVAYIGEDKALLFGGENASGDDCLDDTWVYDLSANTWTNPNPGVKPPKRYLHAMTYIGDDQVLLFGGCDYGCNTYFNDAWVYDLSANTWTNQNPSGSTPSARESSAMSYVGGGDQALLFGGEDAAYNRQNDTWLYDLSANTWTQKSSTSSPSARDMHTMAYLGNKRVVLFGGYDGDRDDETWIAELASAAQDIVIDSISGNGTMSFSGAQVGTTATVQWAASLTDAGGTNWHGFTNVVVTAGIMTNDIPMTNDVPTFFRVRGTPQ
jgi:N-acetylneuraminic acid mutarotase